MKHRWAPTLLLAAALAGCGGDEPAPVATSFAPLHYDYLPKLRLNVGAVEVVDHSLPVGPQDIAASSPAVPAQALAQMARDRLFAAGTAGSATFTIDQASIVREPNGALDGQFAVHLDLTASGGARAGFAEARVARQYVPGSDSENGSANLYALTRQMMDAMNVELEFQVRRTLKPWLVVGGGAPAPVVAQPLGVPGAPPPPDPRVIASPALPPATPETPPIPTSGLDAPQAGTGPITAEPPAAPQTDGPPASPDYGTGGYQDPAALPPAPPQQMSPPPGFLTPPPGASPSLPPATHY